VLFSNEKWIPVFWFANVKTCVARSSTGARADRNFDVLAIDATSSTLHPAVGRYFLITAQIASSATRSLASKSSMDSTNRSSFPAHVEAGNFPNLRDAFGVAIGKWNSTLGLVSYLFIAIFPASAL
jgi:hypothetical protein